MFIPTSVSYPQFFKCLESRRTYIAIGSMGSFFSIVLKLFLGTFQTSRGEKQQNKFFRLYSVLRFTFSVLRSPFSVLCYLLSVRTRMALYAKVIDGFSWNFVYMFVWRICSLCCNPFFEILIFTIFIGFLVFLGLCRFLRWSPDHFQIEVLWFLWAKCTIVRLF